MVPLMNFIDDYNFAGICLYVYVTEINNYLM